MLLLVLRETARDEGHCLSSPDMNDSLHTVTQLCSMVAGYKRIGHFVRVLHVRSAYSLGEVVPSPAHVYFRPFC